MYEATFDLETITPLFLSGNDHTIPELRPPSFKGMMRFWWRAMRSDDDIQRLAVDEAKIFGGTGKGQGKSKLQIRISYEGELRVKKDFLSEIGFEKNGKRKIKDEYAGLGYLFYSTILRDKLRTYIDVGQKYRFIIRSAEKEAFDNGLASLWLTLYLGGIGTRARRGGGNISINGVSQSDSFHLNLQDLFIPSQKSTQEFIKNGFKWVKDIIGPKGQSKSYSTLTDIQIYIGEAKPKWQKALNTVGSTMMEYRSRKKPDYDTFVDYLVGKNPKTSLERPLFGLPLGGRFNNNPQVKGKAFIIEGKDETKRRASPLIIKILRNDTGYIPILIKISGNFLPNNVLTIIDKSKGARQNNHNIHYSSKDIITDFITNSLPTFKKVKL
jgi:CRISPR-associated protein Cmr1